MADTVYMTISTPSGLKSIKILCPASQKKYSVRKMICFPEQTSMIPKGRPAPARRPPNLTLSINNLYFNQNLQLNYCLIGFAPVLAGITGNAIERLLPDIGL